MRRAEIERRLRALETRPPRKRVAWQDIDISMLTDDEGLDLIRLHNKTRDDKSVLTEDEQKELTRIGNKIRDGQKEKAACECRRDNG